MDIRSYFQQARTTAIYPDHARAYYPTLGLVGEFGEFVEKVESGETDADALTKELGDILWYLVNLTLDIGFAPDDVLSKLTVGVRVDQFDELFVLVQTKGMMPKNPLINLGIICEVMKKSIRDTEGNIPEERRMLALEAIVDLWVAVCKLCSIHRLSPSDAASGNLDKLFSRKARGKLQGSGDNR